MKINEQLKRIRKDRKMSAQKLSDLSGVNRSTIHNFENGKMDITTNTLYKLAYSLGATLTISTESDFK